MTEHVSPGAGPTPERITQMAWGFAPAQALASAVDLRVFTHVAAGKRTLEELQRATGASSRGLRMLLDVMVGFGFLARQGLGDAGQYSLTPESEAFLVEGRPGYHGDFVRLSVHRLSQDWKELTRSVQTGAPVVALDRPEEAGEFWGALVEAIMPLSYPSAAQVGRELRRLYPEGTLRLLDVAAGSGVWGIAAAQGDPGVRVVAFDLPETLPHTRRMVERFGLADRFEFRAGNIREGELGQEEFDAAVLGHICHSEGAEHSRRLLAEVARALKPGGTIVIADMLPDDDRSGPPFPLLFALNMLLNTSEGDTFTFADYAAWLQEAGFENPRLFPVPGPSPLVLATRAP